MKPLDFLSGIIFFLVGLGILVKSLTYPIGSIGAPSAGFFPLICSVLMMGLSGLLIVQTALKKDTRGLEVRFFPDRETPKRIFIGLTGLLGFRYLLPVIGFGPSTTLFIFFLSKFIGRFGWKVSIFFSVLTGLASYYLFQVILKVPMPRSILGV